MNISGLVKTRPWAAVVVFRASCYVRAPRDEYYPKTCIPDEGRHFDDTRCPFMPSPSFLQAAVDLINEGTEDSRDDRYFGRSRQFLASFGAPTSSSSSSSPEPRDVCLQVDEIVVPSRNSSFHLAKRVCNGMERSGGYHAIIGPDHQTLRLERRGEDLSRFDESPQFSNGLFLSSSSSFVFDFLNGSSFTRTHFASPFHFDSSEGKALLTPSYYCYVRTGVRTCCRRRVQNKNECFYSSSEA